MSRIHTAVEQGNLEEVRRLLQEDPAVVEALDDHGFSPLFTAVRSREPEGEKVARLLLAHGAQVDLNSAVCLGDLEAVRRILRENPAAVAGARFKNDLVYDAVVLIAGKVLEELDDFFVAADEVLAVIQKHRGILDLLLAHGAEVDGIGFASWPALFEALQMGHPEVARVLLEHGADPNFRSEDGTTAWEMADCSTVKAEMRKLLLSRGYRKKPS